MGTDPKQKNSDLEKSFHIQSGPFSNSQHWFSYLIADLAEIAEELVVVGLTVGQALPLVVPVQHQGQHLLNNPCCFSFFTSGFYTFLKETIWSIELNLQMEISNLHLYKVHFWNENLKLASLFFTKSILELETWNGNLELATL